MIYAVRDYDDSGLHDVLVTYKAAEAERAALHAGERSVMDIYTGDDVLPYEGAADQLYTARDVEYQGRLYHTGDQLLSSRTDGCYWVRRVLGPKPVSYPSLSDAMSAAKTVGIPCVFKQVHGASGRPALIRLEVR